VGKRSLFLLEEISMSSGKERLDYIDVAKALGMFAIYLGHFGEKAGYAYLWVFS